MSATAIGTRVVLTRPQGKNEALAERLNAAGLPALQLPALRIQSLAVETARLPIPSNYDLVVFVSGHAAQLYLQAWAGQRGAPWPAHTLAATVGVASASKLKDIACIPAGQILHPGHDSHQDSESLWQLLKPRLAFLRRVLIVRGSKGREWLGTTLRQAGVQVDRFAMYERIPEKWDADQAVSLAQALSGPCVFLLTSSESVDAASDNIHRLGMEQAWSQARFVVIHERIARRLQSSLQPSGKVEAPMVKLCQPDDDSIFQMITLTASL